MSTVTTGSRLHFGLFSLPVGQAALPVHADAGNAPQPGTTPRSSGQARLPVLREFGGVGLMVQQPAVIVSVQPALQWSAVGPRCDRALAFAQQLARSFENDDFPPAFHIEVESCPAEHIGLGTGTQLGLATATALMKAAAQSTIDVIELARRVGRGLRSGLGIHGFIHGGLLVEAGKGPNTAIAPLVAHASFPDNWRIILMLPPGDHDWHGQRERDAFVRLAEQTSACAAATDALCRLTLLQMLPAVHEANLEAFGDAVYEFNRRVGEMFRPAQGGIYSNPATEALVGYLRGEGVHGVGQSSWGPGVFAIVLAERADKLAQDVGRRFGFEERAIVVAQARNRGATVA